MYKIDHPFITVGLQVLLYKDFSKMHGLPCGGLVASIRGCNVKNGPKKQRSGLIQNIIKHAPPMLGVLTTFVVKTFL